jgi:hypothetical protein
MLDLKKFIDKMHSIKDKINLANLPIFLKYFNAILGVGYDTYGKHSVSYVLVVSSLFLSIASGYTTLEGLCEYVPFFIALIITFGVQGLLFIISWRIGATFVDDKIKTSLFIIYFITMSVSVFFSYSSLLNSIYKPVDRESDELMYSITKANKLVYQITDELKTEYKYDSLVTVIKYSLNDWHSSIIAKYNKTINDIKSNRNNLQKQYLRLDYLAKSKRQQAKLYGDSISKTEAQQYTQWSENKLNMLLPQISKESLIDSLKSTFDNNFEILMKSNESLNNDNFENFNMSHKKLAELVIYENPSSKNLIQNIPKQLYNQISKIDKINQFVAWQKDSLLLNKQTKLPFLKDKLFEFIAKMPKTKNTKIDELQTQILEIGKYGGANVHQFILAIGELKHSNYLAIGSLLIAISIDILVLLCGLLSAKPKPFLNMKDEKDLDEELSLETILALDLDENIKYDSAYINRILLILRLCKPDIESAKEGIPAVISIEDIEKHKLTKEIGVFFALNLAYPGKENLNYIGLRTKLLLWLADQVLNFESQKSTYDTTIESINNNNLK